MKPMKHEDLTLRPGLLNGHRILITGGGTGLGRGIAEACMMLGAKVYICGRRINVLEEAARDLMGAHGGECVALVCDVRIPETVDALLGRIWEDGPLTGLVNNAAGNFISRTEDLSIRGFDAVTGIAFRGAFLVTLEAGKRWLAANDTASVVSIVSSQIWHGGPFTVPNAMAKAGLHAMTMSLAVEWGNRGLRLNAVAPGSFPTDGAAARLKPDAAPASVRHDHQQIPLGRAGRMEELANLVTFLLGDGSTYVNGQTISIDGGRHLAAAGRASELWGWTDDDWEVARNAIRRANDAARAGRD